MGIGLVTGLGWGRAGHTEGGAKVIGLPSISFLLSLTTVLDFSDTLLVTIIGCVDLEVWSVSQDSSPSFVVGGATVDSNSS